MVFNFGTWEVVLLNVLISLGGNDLDACDLSHRTPLTICCIFCLTAYQLMIKHVTVSLFYMFVRALWLCVSDLPWLFNAAMPPALLGH